MTGVTIAVATVIVVAVLVAAAVSASAGRRKRLRERFGPEYDRAVEDYRSQRKAETALAGRQRRVRRLRIRPLTAAERAAYRVRWSAAQERFVDQPDAATADAEALVTTVLRDRGYPAEDYDQILADLSVDYASNLGHYRSAHALSQSAAEGAASTEDLRQAVIHYRAMFDDVLGEPSADGGTAAEVDHAAADGAVAGDGTGGGVPGEGAVGDRVADSRAIENGAVDDGVIDGHVIQGTPADGWASASAADETADVDGGHADDGGELSAVDDHSGQIRNG